MDNNATKELNEAYEEQVFKPIAMLEEDNNILECITTFHKTVTFPANSLNSQQ